MVDYNIYSIRTYNNADLIFYNYTKRKRIGDILSGYKTRFKRYLNNNDNWINIFYILKQENSYIKVEEHICNVNDEIIKSRLCEIIASNKCINKMKNEDIEKLCNIKKEQIIDTLKINENENKNQNQIVNYVFKEPIIEDSTIEEPKIEEPKIEELKIMDKPIIDKPIIDKPKIDKPKIEEPKIIEEPIVEPIVESKIIDKPKIIEEPIEKSKIIKELKFEKKIDEPIDKKIDEPIDGELTKFDDDIIVKKLQDIKDFKASFKYAVNKASIYSTESSSVKEKVKKINSQHTKTIKYDIDKFNKNIHTIKNSKKTLKKNIKK